MAKDLGLKYGRQDLKALLEERNKQNAFLREQLVARTERTAHLEARLLSTLDTLDELQTSANVDLEQAQRENARLLQQLEAWQVVARAADREKSDMSNAVLQLVSKVESCNDYSKWRACRVEFSHDITLQPLRPARVTRGLSSSAETEECNCVHAYSPAIVEELSDSLASEKRAHARTVEEAERRIAVLQSRLAVRDAHITRRVATCRCLPTSRSSDATVHLELISEDDQARIAAQTSENNHVLESEIIYLEEKLRRERRISKSSGTSCKAIQTDPVSASSHVQEADNPKSPSDDEYDAMPVALSALNSQIGQLRKTMGKLITEKDALASLLRNKSDVQDPLQLWDSQHEREADVPKDEALDDTQTPQTKNGEEFQAEFETVLLLEEECIRLMHSEASLRTCIEHLQHREALLMDENKQLREDISKLCSGDPQPGTRLSPPSLPPLDTSVIDLAFPPLQPDAIISPVSATNVERVTVDCCVAELGRRVDRTGSSSSASSSGSPQTPTSLVDPSEVPLPITPTFEDFELDADVDGGAVTHEADEPLTEFAGLTSPQLTGGPLALSPPPGPSLPLVGARDPDAIARELAEARAEAESRERDIEEVRDRMAELAARIGNELHGL